MSASAICLYDVTSREKVPTRQKISNDLSGKSIADMSCAVSSGKVWNLQRLPSIAARPWRVELHPPYAAVKVSAISWAPSG